MLACCHPAIPADAQVALGLKTLGGFGEREIAAAFLSNEVAVTKRLVRARRQLLDARRPVDAAAALRRASELAILPAERELLAHRLAQAVRMSA